MKEANFGRITYSFTIITLILFLNSFDAAAKTITLENCNYSHECFLDAEWNNHKNIKKKYLSYLEKNEIKIKKNRPIKIKHRHILFVTSTKDFVFSSLTFKNRNMEVKPYTYFYVNKPWDPSYIENSKLFSIYYHYDEDQMWKVNYINREIEVKFRYFLISEGFNPVATIDLGDLKKTRFLIDWNTDNVNMLFDLKNKNYTFLLKKIKTEVGNFVGIEEEEHENCSNNIGVIKSYSDKSGTVLLANIPYSYVKGVYGLGCHLQPRVIQVIIENEIPQVSFFDLPYDLGDPP